MLPSQNAKVDDLDAFSCGLWLDQAGSVSLRRYPHGRFITNASVEGNAEAQHPQEEREVRIKRPKPHEIE